MKSVVCAVLLTVLAQAGSAVYPRPFPRPGITKVLETDKVVVWQGLLGAVGRPTAMHRHDMDLVGVFLDPGQVRTTQVDGAVRDGQPFQKGAAVFQPRGVIHVEEVLVDGTRAVGIELKNRASGPSAERSPLDGGRAILENDRVAIREYTWESAPLTRDAGGRDVVLVVLQSGVVESRTRDSTDSKQLVFGDVLHLPNQGTLTERAIGGRPRAIVVEVK